MAGPVAPRPAHGDPRERGESGVVPPSGAAAEVVVTPALKPSRLGDAPAVNAGGLQLSTIRLAGFEVVYIVREGVSIVLVVSRVSAVLLFRFIILLIY